MKAARILYLLPSLAGGGAERVASILAPRFAAAGRDVAVAVLRGGGVFESDLGPDVELISLGTERVSRSIGAILNTIHTWKPDAILVTHTHLNVLVGLLRPLFSREIAVLGRESNQPSLILPTMRAGPILKLCYRAAYRRFDRVICQSEDMREDMTQAFGIATDRIVVIHNPLSSACMQAGISSRISSTPQTLLVVGRLTPQKGIDSVLRAMALLPRGKYRLVIVGEGGERQRLERLATELGISALVSWEGFASDPLSYYRNADVFVLGSRYEGFPNALIEALSQGTPAAAFACPGDISRIIRAGIDGFLATPENPASLAQAIERVVEAGLDRSLIAANARERFRAETIATKYLATIDQALVERRGRP